REKDPAPPPRTTAPAAWIPPEPVAPRASPSPGPAQQTHTEPYELVLPFSFSPPAGRSAAGVNPVDPSEMTLALAGSTPGSAVPGGREHVQSRPKVAYLTSRFPKLTETFVLYEMQAVEAEGARIELYPLQYER